MDIIKQFFYAKKQKYESYRAIRRKIDASCGLGYQASDAELFGGCNVPGHLEAGMISKININ